MPKMYGTPGPRVLSPDCCTSQSLARCSVGAQLLFDRLIVQSDDQGRQQADPFLVKAHCFPQVPGVAPRQVGAWLAELEAAGMLVRYASGNVPVLQLVGWWAYQSGMRRAYASRWEPPEGWTDRVYGLQQDAGDVPHPARTLPASRPQSARTLPAKCPPRARGSYAGAYAGARADAPAREGLPSVDNTTIVEAERIVGRPMTTCPWKAEQELDRLCEDHGGAAVRSAMAEIANGGRLTWNQLVFGAMKALEPIPEPARKTEAERREERLEVGREWMRQKIAEAAEGAGR